MRDVDCRRGEVGGNARDIRYRRGDVGKENVGHVMSDVVEMKSELRMASGVAEAKMRKRNVTLDIAEAKSKEIRVMSGFPETT